ncbi:MAG: hypothetical protein H0V49_06155 [Nocardioidaceae bacterium]|nr:hypothetical protein [Nocardioidaceae bacterium]
MPGGPDLSASGTAPTVSVADKSADVRLPPTSGPGIMGAMSESQQRVGEVFLDARGHGRSMRLTWHREADVVVLSLWRDDMCTGTFRLAIADVNDFIDALVDGIRDAPGVQVNRPVEPITTTTAVPMPPQRISADEAFADWAFTNQPAHRATSN